jgi:NAD(P)H-flavin reductase
MSTNTEQTMYLPELGTIEQVETMTATEKYFRIKLNSGKEFGHEPGQFASFTMLGIGEAPISISSSSTDKGGFDIVVRKIGNVTGAMHNLKVGDTIGVRGPFGTHFPYEETKGRDILFVAGGIGLVPARSFINYVLDNRADYGKVTILFGARTPSERLFVSELEEWKKRDDIEFLETVDKGDDSWTGNVGVITTLFPKISVDAAKTTCVVVGPPIMYKFVIIEAKKAGIADEDIFVDLERRMKCGVGKCGHCQINELYCCQDGSVFKYSDLASVPEAL